MSTAAIIDDLMAAAIDGAGRALAVTLSVPAHRTLAEIAEAPDGVAVGDHTERCWAIASAGGISLRMGTEAFAELARASCIEIERMGDASRARVTPFGRLFERRTIEALARRDLMDVTHRSACLTARGRRLLALIDGPHCSGETHEP